MTDKRPDEVIAFVKETYGEIPREDLKEFLKLLGEAAVPDLQRLEAELSAGRWTEAADSAHRLRNFTQAVGAAELSEPLQAMESELRAGTGGGADVQLAALCAPCVRLAALVIRLASEPNGL
jgi:HPt (histidine-containing phosphotransfer) domain-containing protein